MTSNLINDFQREAVSVWDVLMMLRRNAKIILTGAAAGLTLATLFVVLVPPSYVADTDILIDPRGIPSIRDSNNENYTLDSSQIETHIVNLKSRALAESVIRRLNLLKDVEYEKVIRSASGDTAREMALAINYFRRHLDVGRIGISYVVNVAYRAKNAERAAEIANETAAAYLLGLVEAKAEGARIAGDWLEGELAKLRVKMNNANRDVQKAKISQDYRILPARPDETAKSEGGDNKKKAVSIEELELTAATYRTVYQNSLNTLTELVQRESFPATDVRVISVALTPEGRSGILKIMVLGFLMGAMLGTGLAIVTETWSRGKS